MGCVLTRSGVPLNHISAGSGNEPLLVVSSNKPSSSSSSGRVAPLPPVEDAPMLYRPLKESQSKPPQPSHKDGGLILVPPKSLPGEYQQEHENVSTEATPDTQGSGSASSPSSKKSDASTDSGVYELDDDYSHVITEYSDPEKVRMVEEAFSSLQTNVELIIEGHACPRRMTPLMKEKNEQEEILQKLREEGLVVQPEARASGGLKFELVEADNDDNARKQNSLSVRRLPPISLQQRQRKRKRELTSEDIQKKLDEAEQRRKQMEEEKRNRLATKEKIADVTSLVTQKVEEQKQQLTEKMEQTAKSREQQLLNIKEKIRAREERAEAVRQRKQLLESITIPDAEPF